MLSTSSSLIRYRRTQSFTKIRLIRCISYDNIVILIIMTHIGLIFTPFLSLQIRCVKLCKVVYYMLCGSYSTQLTQLYTALHNEFCMYLVVTPCLMPINARPLGDMNEASVFTVMRNPYILLVSGKCWSSYRFSAMFYSNSYWFSGNHFGGNI